MDDTSKLLETIWTSLGGKADQARQVEFTAQGALPSAFPVTDLAASSMAAAGLALDELRQAAGHGACRFVVDRRLASFWFSSSLRPLGWQVPPLWDPVAGNYATRDGWIRLHTNAPHHRAAAERVLGGHEDRAGMAASVAAWDALELETAIVQAGGCAAQMRSAQDWAGHPQGLAVAAEPLIHMQTHASPERARNAAAFDPARPLRGLKVLDLTRVLAGPTATRFLAAYGAQVLRVDPPTWDEPGVVPEMTLGKRCARLDLHKPQHRTVFEQLLAGADIMLHGYRSDALERLGYGAEWRRVRNPGLIDVSLDAYGWSGPWATRRGFDSLVQMSCGIAHAGMLWQQTDKPFPLPVQALDYAAGYLLAAAAVRGVAMRLTGAGALQARTSLARTAKLLLDQGADKVQEPALASESAEDLAAMIEHTAWGEARRIAWPIALPDCPASWPHPASALGSAPARWESEAR
ncbi:CoA transferase [Bordetella sp. FB-8]|uniref:CoA transferase n=1 Tax=Bordetella sp. FB-8 TaxID=1159870 RepID=UPI0003653DBD|nr:CoA transferase [Bordetella sp. FB-8]